MSNVRVALLALLLALVSGCGAARSAAPHPATPPLTPPPAPAVAPLPPAAPVGLRIDVIDVTSTLVPLGLNADDTIEVPPVENPMQAGWYRHGPTPGEIGPAVILGHVDGGGRAGVFARLDELSTGDEIAVTRGDGRTAVFAVTRSAQLPKSRFPTEAVYGDTRTAQLRLITCGGEFDESGGSYRDNVIVYAALAAVR